MKVQATGILWFRDAAQYHDYKKIFTDSDVLAASYTDWRKQADKLVKNLERQGHRIIKVDAEISEFVAWCKSSGTTIDAKGRMGFANFKAYQQLVSEQ
ncbi:hypothetical protein HAX39_25485 [Citrobacter freundii]|nr:hypothetical protein [Citrobacter freundii]